MTNKLSVGFVVITLWSLCLAGVMGLSTVSASSTQTVDVWVEYSTKKIFKTDLCPANPRISVNLYAAQGEWESFQIGIRTSFDPIKNLNLTISNLVNGNRTIPSSSIQAYQVCYVPANNTGVDWPDPLLPISLASGTLVESNQTQPIWVTIRVPRDCVPGNYSGSVTLAPTGYSSVVIPIHLTVWNFPIPVTPRCTTAFNIDMNMVADKHGITNSAQIYNLHKIYYEFLLERRISPYYIPPYVGETQYWETSAAASYLSDPRMTSFQIPYLEGNDESLTRLLSYLKAKGYYDKGYYYVVDEPMTADHYERLWTAANRLAVLDPTYRMIAPFFINPLWSLSTTPYQHLAGDLGIWCPKACLFSDATYQMRQQERIDAGDEGWMYVCWEPSFPYPNLLMDMPAMYHRVLPWVAKKYNNKGICYWNVSYWTFVADPWFDMRTVKDLSLECYGDGSLLYPGRRAGVDLVNGPVSSIRLEVLRDGLDDYDYLCMVESCCGADRMANYMNQMISSVNSFQTDPWTMETVRQAMGSEIEANFSAKKFPDGFQRTYKKSQLLSEGFESGGFTAKGWTSNGCSLTDTSANVYAGTYSAMLNGTDSLTKTLSTEGYENIQLVYTCKTVDLLFYQRFYAEWYDGSLWHTLESMAGTNSTYQQRVFILPAEASNNSHFQIRFRLSAGTSNFAYLDHVKITGEPISQQHRFSGDANGDGLVDVGDLGILAANYGTSSGATWAMGDFNDDGAVDVSDLGILAANYGTGTSGADFTADYTKVFKTTSLLPIADETSEDDITSDLCTSLGFSLIAGLALLGLMAVTMEE